MSKLSFWNLKKILLLCLLISLPAGARAAAETNAATAPDAMAKPAETAISTETLRAYLQFQEQLREAQAAIDRARREAEEVSLQNSVLLSNRLHSIEQSLAAQRQLEAKSVETMQGTGRFMLGLLAVFSGVGFLAIVLTAYFQWRAIHRLGEISSAMPAMRPFGTLSAPVLTASESHLIGAGSAEESSTRLLGAIERLEKRMAELEQASHPALTEPDSEMNGEHSEPPRPPAATVSSNFAAPDNAARIKALLDDGQKLLNQDKSDEAITRFNDALTLDPANTDALVKKGLAYEKARKLTEAIECYDRAIAVDGTLTIAYLHKGGLFNRMERFSEAVECYEQALRTQERKRAA